MQGTRLAYGGLEVIEVTAVVEGPGGWIPGEGIVSHLIQFRSPLGVIRNMIVKEERCAQEGLHLFA